LNFIQDKIMAIIPLPRKVSYENVKNNFATLVIEPLYPGYGTTIGNLLRRVLISSLGGAAIDKIKIKGAEHEFSTIESVKEDVVEIILNIKKIRIKANNVLTEPLSLKLSASGEGEVTAGQIEVPSDIEIVNPNFKIATITDKTGVLEMDLIVSAGRGYVPVEQRESDDKEVGAIIIDANYSPIVKVGMELHNVRVDKMTNYDSLALDIETDGTRTPEEAVHESINIINEQLNFIVGGESADNGSGNEAKDAKAKSQSDSE
jgi:DNA-directed RNA polymerase subunit alpha